MIRPSLHSLYVRTGFFFIFEVSNLVKSLLAWPLNNESLLQMAEKESAILVHNMELPSTDVPTDESNQMTSSPADSNHVTSSPAVVVPDVTTTESTPDPEVPPPEYASAVHMGQVNPGLSS